MRISFVFSLFLAISTVAEKEIPAQRKNLRSQEDQKERSLISIKVIGTDPSVSLGQCEGDCDSDSDCQGSLVCWERGRNEPVPGCSGGENDHSRTDYCVDPRDIGSSPTAPPPPNPTPTPPRPNPSPTPPNPPPQGSSGNLKKIVSYGSDPGSTRLPLGECEGDCDDDGDCGSGLYCYQRGNNDPPPPGCYGGDPSRTDYCARRSGGSAPAPTPPAPAPTRPAPTPTPPPVSNSNPSPTLPSASLQNFALKMYWQQGYFWQEETIERKWCMRCRGGTCSNGEMMFIEECGNRSERFDFVPVNNQEVLIKIHNSNLCFERESKLLYMRPCDDRNTRQYWFAKNGAFDSYRFEISQASVSSLCITQRHHPKADEELHLEPCTQAEASDTSYWNRY